VEISIAFLDDKPLAGVIRMTGNKLKIIAPKEAVDIAPVDEANNSQLKSKIVDIDGNVYTCFHFGFREARLSVGRQHRLETSEASVVSLVKGGFLQKIDFGLMSHPWLTSYLDRKIDALKSKYETKEKTGFTKPFVIKRENIVDFNTSSDVVTFNCDVSEVLSATGGYSFKTSVKMKVEEVQETGPIIYKLSAIGCLLSILIFDGNYHSQEDNYFEVGEFIDPDDEARKAMGVVLGHAPHHFKSNGKLAPSYSLIEPDEFISLANFLMTKERYQHAIRLLYSSLKPGLSADECVDKLMKAVEYCNVAAVEKPIPLSVFEGMQNLLRENGYGDYTGFLGNYVTLRDKLSSMIQDFFSTYEIMNFIPENFSADIVKFRNSQTHGFECSKTILNRLFENFYKYRVVISLSILNLIIKRSGETMKMHLHGAHPFTSTLRYYQSEFSKDSITQTA